jgi:aminoglycoside 3-N-acetyltransferase I
VAAGSDGLDIVGMMNEMSAAEHFSIGRLKPDDVALMEGMLTVFGDAFGEVETYSTARPSAAYLGCLLGSDIFIAIAALKSGKVVAGPGCV